MTWPPSGRAGSGGPTSSIRNWLCLTFSSFPFGVLDSQMAATALDFHLRGLATPELRRLFNFMTVPAIPATTQDQLLLV